MRTLRKDSLPSPKEVRWLTSIDFPVRLPTFGLGNTAAHAVIVIARSSSIQMENEAHPVDAASQRQNKCADVARSGPSAPATR